MLCVTVLVLLFIMYLKMLSNTLKSHCVFYNDKIKTRIILTVSRMLSVQLFYVLLTFSDIESGHVPDATNVPFGMILDQKSKTVKSADALKQVSL